jgi:uncharacterized membrane protein
MKKKFISTVILLLCCFFMCVPGVRAQTNPPVVKAVLFYSPTCPHCHEVINNTLLPMIDQYQGQLDIIGIDVTQQKGQELFLATLKHFKLENGGVPFLVIDDTYLIGSVDIPAKFPGLVESYLEQGGVDLPDLPGLRELLPPTETPSPTAEQPSATPVPNATPQATPTMEATKPHFTTSEELTWQERFAHDKAGNTLAVILLAGMIGASGWTAAQFKKIKGTSLKENWSWIIPILTVIGFGVAGYLAYVETAEVAAVCGPVGDCNTVQQSEYARLFGILPIGVLGLMGYVAIFISWLAARFTSGRLADMAAIALFGMGIFGALFSIYLTFLEPFVIGATCMWCLTSAALITAIMVLSASPAKLALEKLGIKI